MNDFEFAELDIPVDSNFLNFLYCSKSIEYNFVHVLGYHLVSTLEELNLYTICTMAAIFYESVVLFALVVFGSEKSDLFSG